MSEQMIIKKAQQMLDDLMVKLQDYNIPASHDSLRFFESILNGNGFSGVSINIDSAATLMPVVTEAFEYNDIFDRSEGI